MNKNKIPQNLRENTKFFDHSEDETNLDRQLDRFLEFLQSDEEIVAYRKDPNEDKITNIWTTNYILFPIRGMLGDSYLGWMPRNPHDSDIK